MNDIAVRITNLEKAYRIWNSPSARLKAALLQGVAGAIPPLRKVTQSARAALYRDFYALRNINLEVKRGESVAIIGRNGCGKSTLLQTTAGTLPPTAGQVEINGRVAALLELGSGFNPECTGRENVLLNATVLGLTPDQALDRFDEIAAFAEIGDFIDQPVKTYSTGMAVRLAFAVLTQIEPEILIIDEALAVGDFLFQQKCFDVIRRFRASGCSFLLVSHSMGTVLELCDRALVLNNGTVEFLGSAEEAVRVYEASAVRALFRNVDGKEAVQGATKYIDRSLQQLDAVSEEETSNPLLNEEISPELGSIVTEKAALVFTKLFDRDRRETDVIASGTEIVLSMLLKSNVDLDDPHVGFKIRDSMGRIIFETSSYCMHKRIGRLEAGQEVNAEFSFSLPLAEGEYSVVVGFANGGYGQYFYRDLILYIQAAKTFQIVKSRSDDLWSGIVNLRPKFLCRVSAMASPSK